ncbi:MAG: aminotransferase class III-fold pyridoxal phosphate-dependent enzyme, partial [Saprospiraceae bacterium]|nr:aminotransferase class III-fold pyridoxal phosphate-dependent enzyme [Saprospiraceae bacterium]
MSLFQVYPLFPVELVRGKGAYVYDSSGQKYLDLYGGHAVISVGHSHPKFAAALKQQIDELIFYSNSVENPFQTKLAEQLALQSGYTNHHLFMISSGAEANENGLKLASFHTGKSRIICFEGGFHGRTTGVVAATDNPKILPEYG